MELKKRLEACAVENLAVNEILDRVSEHIPVNCKNGINIKKSYNDDIPEIKCDALKLKMVFFNIMTNACQSINETGTLDIKTSVENGHVVVDIWNDGPVISGDIIGRIFDPFFTTRVTEESAGLGLFTCHETVKNLNGKLNVKSNEDMGTTFTVKIPHV